MKKANYEKPVDTTNRTSEYERLFCALWYQSSRGSITTSARNIDHGMNAEAFRNENSSG